MQISKWKKKQIYSKKELHLRAMNTLTKLRPAVVVRLIKSNQWTFYANVKKYPGIGSMISQ